MTLDHRTGRIHGGAERRLRTVEIIRSNGELEVLALAGMLEVSLETIRRDLRDLESQGLVRRTYGRVYSVESGVFETDLATRQRNNPEEKRRIARAVSDRVGQSQTVFIDEGFQMQLVAESLPESARYTVVTAALPVATTLAQRPNVQVIILGGRVRGNTLGVVDSWAEDRLRSMNIDLAIVGANGVSIEGGLSTPDPAVAAIKAAAIKASSRRIFCGAHHKFGRQTFITFAQLAEFEHLITGRELPQTVASRFSAAGAQLVLV